MNFIAVAARVGRKVYLDRNRALNGMMETFVRQRKSSEAQKSLIFRSHRSSLTISELKVVGVEFRLGEKVGTSSFEV